MAFEAVDAYIEDPENQVDSKRIYVMGLSMGGYGTWDAIQRRPNFFAAAVPICGGGDTSLAPRLTKLPIWAWHGDQDKVIKPSRSRDMIDAIKKIGGTPKYSEIKGRGHNSWVDCWKSQEMWTWLYSQKNKGS
jgi:predicted peptidase